MARALPSGLELNRPDGSASDAPPKINAHSYKSFRCRGCRRPPYRRRAISVSSTTSSRTSDQHLPWPARADPQFLDRPSIRQEAKCAGHVFFLVGVFFVQRPFIFGTAAKKPSPVAGPDSPNRAALPAQGRHEITGPALPPRRPWTGAHDRSEHPRKMALVVKPQLSDYRSDAVVRLLLGDLPARWMRWRTSHWWGGVPEAAPTLSK